MNLGENTRNVIKRKADRNKPSNKDEVQEQRLGLFIPSICGGSRKKLKGGGGLRRMMGFKVGVPVGVQGVEVKQKKASNCIFV